MGKFENGVAGFGFLALAVMIFGQWKSVNIGLAALLFGLFRALSNVYTGFDVLVALKLPSTLYNMFPYIFSDVLHLCQRIPEHRKQRVSRTIKDRDKAVFGLKRQ